MSLLDPQVHLGLESLKQRDHELKVPHGLVLLLLMLKEAKLL
jgi:hypothetical protein